jgi:hypothetical protein
MALTFGQMTAQILAETYRDDSFSTAVQNAIVSAIKELETEELFLNQKFAPILVPDQTFIIPLPEDFISVLVLTLANTEGRSIYTAAQGFKETTFYELQTYKNQSYINEGIPGMWALYENNIHIYPAPAVGDNYILQLFYYFRDGTYPSNPNDTSIWMDDFTQDVTRYTARGIFYRDSLQSPELAASDMQKAQDALARLKIRNSQRENLNNLSY